jgi:protein dithiol oxidoreductase (disulfide-forming)
VGLACPSCRTGAIGIGRQRDWNRTDTAIARAYLRVQFAPVCLGGGCMKKIAIERARMDGKYFFPFAAALAFLFWAPVCQAQLVAGRDFELLQPAQPTADRAKVEVMEFFSYGCHSCNDFYPYLAQWASKLPKDVVLVKTAISLGYPQWEPLARTYYALQASGELARLDKAVFHAVHDQRLRLYDDQSIIQWAATQRVDAQKFAALLSRDFSVATQARQAESAARSYKALSTPMVIVDGKYRLISSKPYAEWPGLIDQLIAKARAEKKANQ